MSFKVKNRTKISGPYKTPKIPNVINPHITEKKDKEIFTVERLPNNMGFNRYSTAPDTIV